MNDIIDQTNYDTWHEGDWEHISMKLSKSGNNYTPVSINLYQHEGGHTKNAITEGKWVSNPNNFDFVSTNIPVDGWETNYDQPLIFLASNSHASYFYGDLVYNLIVNVPGPYDEDFKDEVNYDLSGASLFNYDFIEKLGEAEIKTGESFHGGPFAKHVVVNQNSKEWLGFTGRCGTAWNFNAGQFLPFLVNFGTSTVRWLELFGVDVPSVHVQTPSPYVPTFNREYYEFSYNLNGFGNTSEGSKTIYWINYLWW